MCIRSMGSILAVDCCYCTESKLVAISKRFTVCAACVVVSFHSCRTFVAVIYMAVSVVRHCFPGLLGVWCLDFLGGLSAVTAFCDCFSGGGGD